MAEDVIIRFRAEVDELTQKINAVIRQQEELTKGIKKTNEQLAIFDKRGNQIGSAFSTKPIEDFNNEVQNSQKNIKGFGQAVDKEIKPLGGIVKNIGAQIAGAFATAFTVQQVIAFGKASIDAFLEAEVNANKLQFAISEIAKESDTVFDGLIKQSKELQKTTIFSSGSIQQAQTLLATFDLTGQQIEELIPKLADFATVTGTDIVTAANSVGQGIQGMGKAFEKYGIEVSSTKTEQENFNALLEGFSKFQGAAASATQTATGRIKQQANQISDLQEKLGEKLLPTMNAIRAVAVRALTGIVNLFTKSESASEKAAKQFTEVATEFNLLAETLKRGNLTQEQRGELIKQINEQYGEYLPNLLTEKSSLEEINLAQKAVNDSITARIVLMQQEEEITKIIQNTIAANKDLLQIEIERIKLQSDLSDNATAAAAKQEELNRRQALANAIIEDSKKRLADLQKSYADLAARLGLNTDAQSKLKNEIEGTREAVDKLVNALDEISPEQAEKLLSALQKIDLARVSGSIADFRDAVGEASKEVNEQATKDFEESLKKQNEARVNATKEVDDNREDTLKKEQELNDAILASTEQTVNAIAGFYSDFLDGRINQVDEQLNAELSAIDAQEQALNNSLDKRIISQSEFTKQQEALEQKRLEAQKKADKETRKLKRQQLIIDKTTALIEIGLDLQKAIAAYTSNPITATLLPVIAGVITAALAAVSAVSIPAFKKGTKGKKGSGMALVGEEGPELTFLPTGAKVVPARQTKAYSELIDAMYDNNVDKYILKQYVAPRLEAQRRQYQDAKDQTFVKNIVNNMSYNGLSLSDQLYANSRGVAIKDKKELAALVGKAVAENIPRTDPWRM